MKTHLTRVRPAPALLTLLAVWLLTIGLWAPMAAPISLVVQGAATALGLIPGPVLLVAVAAAGWRLHHKFPPAPPA